MKLFHVSVGPIGTNCYVAVDDLGRGAIIDPGAEADQLAEMIWEHNITPELILLTHGHWDHVGGVKELKKKFPEVKVVIGKKDVPILENALERSAFGGMLNKSDYEGLHADIEVSQGESVDAGDLTFHVIETPGHTPGGVCYIIGDCIFSGDTLFYHECGRCDLDGGDYPAMLRSLKRLSEIEGDYSVLPGHDITSTLDEERKNNPYIKEALECN